MATSISRDKAMRWVIQGTLLLLILVAAYAVMVHLKVEELEGSVAQARADTEKANQAAAAGRKKLQDDLNAATSKVAAAEKNLRDSDDLKILLGKVEPQIVPVLEAAAKTAKPDARASLIAAVGVIGQIAHGANHDAAVGALVRALSIDKDNCVAGLAANLGGAKSEVAPDCQAMLPAPAAEAKPAPAKPAAEAPAKPAAEAPAKPAAEPAAPAAPKGKA